MTIPPYLKAEMLVEAEEAIKKRYAVAEEELRERMTFTGSDCDIDGRFFQEQLSAQFWFALVPFASQNKSIKCQ